MTNVLLSLLMVLTIILLAIIFYLRKKNAQALYAIRKMRKYGESSYAKLSELYYQSPRYSEDWKRIEDHFRQVDAKLSNIGKDFKWKYVTVITVFILEFAVASIVYIVQIKTIGIANVAAIPKRKYWNILNVNILYALI